MSEHELCCVEFWKPYNIYWYCQLNMSDWIKLYIHSRKRKWITTLYTTLWHACAVPCDACALWCMSCWYQIWCSPSAAKSCNQTLSQTLYTGTINTQTKWATRRKKLSIAMSTHWPPSKGNHSLLGTQCARQTTAPCETCDHHAHMTDRNLSCLYRYY